MSLRNIFTRCHIETNLQELKYFVLQKRPIHPIHPTGLNTVPKNRKVKYT